MASVGEEEKGGASSRPDSDESDMEEGDDDQEEAGRRARVAELDQKLAEDPTDYQAHLERIRALKDLAELEPLRSAREDFSRQYPLSPELWLEWLKDEQGLAAGPEDRVKVARLFERAAEDYVSPDVWLEYCHFSLGGDLGSEGGVAGAREVFEKAVAAVGLNAAKGALVWEAYREFESALASAVTGEEGRKAQRARVDKLFRRQLTVPLLDMEATLEEYREWRGGVEVDRPVLDSYRAAADLLKEREPLEEALMQAEAGGEEQLKRYGEYVALERKAGLPARIRALYERRVTDHCLVASSWKEYTDYLDATFRDGDASLPVHRRAVRNCPWAGDLWTGLLRALERYGRSAREVTEAFEQSLAAGLGDPADYGRVWLAFIDYRRRAMKYDDYGDDDEGRAGRERERVEMRELFGRALGHIAGVPGADPDFWVARYWASMEGDRFGSMEEARKVWADLLPAAGNPAGLWAEYIQLEKYLGDTKHLRKLFPKALERCRDWPEKIGELWVQFEREEGTLGQLEEAEAKVAKRTERAAEARGREAAKEEEAEQRKKEKVEKKKDKDKEKRRERRHEAAEAKRELLQKRKAEEPAAFKEPPAPGARAKSVAPPPGYKVKPPPGFKAPEPPTKKARCDEGESTADQPRTQEEGADRDARTVFVSNLDFGVGPEEIRNVLSTWGGTVTDVRLVKGQTGKSRGFAYVEFSSRDEASAAIGHDRHPLNGRPMFISESNKDKKGHQFKYETGRVEENKLFVRNLPASHGKEELEALFGPYGNIRDIRIVTFRNGHSKGIAFVEFEEARSAQAAVTGADGRTVGGKPISVAISNPPPRKSGPSSVPSASPADAAPGTSNFVAGARQGPKGKLQVAFVPRSLQLKRDQAGDNGHANGAKEKARSNSDFRDMLLNRK